MLSYKVTGDFKNLDKFLAAMHKGKLYSALDRLASAGASALASATPKDTGLAAASWGYDIKVSPGGCTITWTNSDIENGFPVAIMLQYGHGTGTGGYVQGRDFINPALRPIFDQLAEQVWKEVTSA